MKSIGCAVALAAGSAFSQTASEDFEDGSLSPFNVELLTNNVSEIIEPSGFPARAGTNVHHMVWYADNYDGSRTGKGVEGASSGDRITDEGWYGFSFYAPSSFPIPGKQMVLAQIICWHPSLPDTSITITFGVNTNGAFVLEGAYGVGDGGKTTTVYSTLSTQFSKGEWHDAVIYCKFSRINTGVLSIWIDGVPEESPTAEFTGINLGNGAWSADELMTNGGYIKWGLYCWDTGNYDAGESREIYFDEIAYQVGNPDGAFDLVKPTGYGLVQTNTLLAEVDVPAAVVLTGGTSQSGTVYRLQVSESLTNATWTTLPYYFEGGSTNLYYVDPDGLSSQRFYRLIEE